MIFGGFHPFRFLYNYYEVVGQVGRLMFVFGLYWLSVSFGCARWVDQNKMPRMNIYKDLLVLRAERGWPLT
jgi:hypothetical protein